ncbi:MAG: hypothetical protein RL329_2567 [Bacteroidota bacterium]
MLLKIRKIAFPLLACLTLASVYFTFQLRFAFDFKQFFPDKDPDNTFFQQFVKDFEPDDNFLLVAVQRDSGVFDSTFLAKIHDFTLQARDLPYIKSTQSLTKIQLPVKTAFGITTIPAIHLDAPEAYANDREKLLQDPRFVKNLIDTAGKTLVVLLKTRDSIDLAAAEILMPALDSLVQTFDFQAYHFMGSANFQKELVKVEKREVAMATAIAAVLVGLILWIIFRKWASVMIALVSVGLGMLFFLGLLGAWGRDLSVMAALYPVLMVIIGTSDVIHMLSKYIDELKRGNTPNEAISITIKEIGLATLMTAVTTAIGFATLVTSRIIPIQEFGVNAAVGVMVAYVTVLLVTLAIMPFFKVEQLIQMQAGNTRVEILMEKIYHITRNHSKWIGGLTVLLLVICTIGIFNIRTNYTIAKNLPLYEKVTDDFYFFEKNFAGFRPLEYAVFAQNQHRADDFEVLKEMEKVEKHLKSVDAIRSVTSMTMVYKSIHQLNNGNLPRNFCLPEDSVGFSGYQALAKKMPAAHLNVLLSKDGSKARIATRILDLGADSVMAIGDKIDVWIAQNTDSKIAKFKRTGTGYIIDKNATYIRADLLEGIAWEVGLIAILMGFLFKKARMVVIFLIPNLIPLFFAGGMIGFLGVDLDASIAMVFTVVFGIAIDDTIHFLSSFRLNQSKGESVEKALHTTMIETGKPVFLTTIILFCGFLVMLFSHHPPSVIVGKLIAVTLLTALASDLFINPLLIRAWMK